MNWKKTWSKTKSVSKKAFAPGKYKGVRVVSDAVDVVKSTPKQLLFRK